VGTVTSIFLYILRMALHTRNRFIPCRSDFSQIRPPSVTRSRQQDWTRRYQEI